jgi:beta-galactosidase
VSARRGSGSTCWALAILWATLLACCAAGAATGRERLSLDRGWVFHLGDIATPEVRGHTESYLHAKAGNAPGAAAATFDDSQWRPVDLPHDWAVEGPFDPQANVSQGYRPRGIGWYRRYLKLDAAERGRHVELQFDGIATHSTVWVNGNLVSRNWSGYTGNNIDITPYLRYGDEFNTIAVRVDATRMEGWWYEGAGIYRHAWLVKRAPVHIATDGVHATPRRDKAGAWSIPVAVTLGSAARAAAQVTVRVDVSDPSGRAVHTASRTVAIDPLAPAGVRLRIPIAKPVLWSVDTPRLYTVRTRVLHAGREIDAHELKTGLRTVRFDPRRGLFLNDEHVKLQGVCIHQDHAGVGVAVPDAIWAYRLRRLKELGVNAIRFSHHAVAAEVLDLVDRMGFLVMDENRNFNPSPDYMLQLEWMVKRDRHRPGVVLWSVFNEEPMQGTEAGYEMARRMVARVRALDDTRPVTAAMNGGFFSPLNVAHAVDVLGANYQAADYDAIHRAFPDLPFTSSEDTSAFMTRGEFVTDPGRNVIASYDEDFAQWGSSHRDGWEAIRRRDYLAGGFVWTGFDYRGEPTPHEWPSVSSFFGIMDLNGFAKTAYYIHQVQCIKDKPLVHIAPHWNWPGEEGANKRVMVMANVERIVLLLNGRQIGEQAVDNARMNHFDVPYQPGRLEAIGYRQGREVARAAVETAGVAVRLELLPDRAQLHGDGRDAMPVTVRALDAAGRLVPNASPLVTLTTSGSGRSIGHGNGDPNSHEDEKGAQRRLFNGLAQLIVQSHDDVAGDMSITASAAGLQPARLTIPVLRTAPVASVPVTGAPPAALVDWRISPVYTQRPDPGQKLADFDMNSWAPGRPPMRLGDGDGAGARALYRLYRTVLTPRTALQQGTATIEFAGLRGLAEVWLDGRLLSKKTGAQSERWSVALPPGAGARELTVLVESAVGDDAGFEGAAMLEAAR